MSSAPATMNSANDYYLCVGGVGVLICGWRNQFTRLVLIFAFSQVIAKLFVFLVAPRIFIMNLDNARILAHFRIPALT